MNQDKLIRLLEIKGQVLEIEAELSEQLKKLRAQTEPDKQTQIGINSIEALLQAIDKQIKTLNQSIREAQTT